MGLTKLDHQAEVWEWIKTLTNKENGVAQVFGGAGSPGGRIECWTDPKLAAVDPIYANMVKVFPNGAGSIRWPANNHRVDLVKAIDDNLVKYFKGQVSLNEATTKAAQDANAFISNLGTQAIQVLGPSAQPAQRAARFRQLFESDFDIAGAARFVLGPSGRTMTPQQLQEFAGLFREYLVQAYTRRLGEYGGEQFRVALARVILRDPAVYVIEEPATPLDDDTKSMLDDTFSRILPGKTILFLPHRISTIRSCDRLFVLHRGQLQAAGDHRELLAKNDLYRHLHYLEFNEFAEHIGA